MEIERDGPEWILVQSVVVLVYILVYKKRQLAVVALEEDGS